jgi:hypothetical protein
MAETNDGRAHNKPSHEAQVKGGEHSHSGSESKQGSTTGSHNQPSHEASVKGGQHSHSGSGNK